MVIFPIIVLRSVTRGLRMCREPHRIIKALNASLAYVSARILTPASSGGWLLAILLLSGAVMAQIGPGLNPKNASHQKIERQVTLVLEADRLIASNARLSRLDEWVLQADEKVVASKEAEAVLVVVTNQRVLGYGPVVGWRELRLASDEAFEALLAEDYAAFVTTTMRLLNFNADTGIWAQRVRSFR